MTRRRTQRWLARAACLASFVAASSAAAQAGVLARGFSDQAHCSPGGEHTAIDGTCADLACEPGRACVELAGVGARCIDPLTEIVCVAESEGCEGCPMNLTTGADVEECRLVTLAEGAFTLCFYSPRLLCLTENSFDFDALLCLPSTVNEPSIAEGDCDADGVPNGEDTCLCEAGTGPSCAPIPIDAGVADAGTALDASVDAARPSPDASRDAAAPRITPVFRGGGGCTCSVRGSARDRSSFALFVVVALWLRRR